MRFKTAPAHIIFVFATALAIAGAFGYALEGQKWPQGSNVTMQLSLGTGTQTLMDGFTSFNQSAEDALAQWNRYLARLQFSVVRNSSVTPRSGDRQNSVFFAKNVFGDPFGADTLAVTLRVYQGTTLVEADVVFNTAMPFNSYRGPLQDSAGGGQLHDLHRIAIHEFGHVLGLDHPDEHGQRVIAIMNAYEDDTDALQQDDINGGQYLYGAAASPTPTPAPAARLVNLSTRGVVGTGDAQLIGGFIVQGSAPASIAIRALGPSLGASGISGALPNPVVELRDASGAIVQSDDDWQNDPATATLQSKGLAPGNTLEAATIANLAAGNYTSIVRGSGGTTGVGLLEFYDLQTSDSRLANISTRDLVQTGDRVMIAGFIISGTQSKQVVLRAIGPSLANAGITGVLGDPVLELKDSSGAVVIANDDWASASNAASIQSSGLAPSHEYESAILTTLAPGSYTAVVHGYDNGVGIGLVELYDVP